MVPTREKQRAKPSSRRGARSAAVRPKADEPWSKRVLARPKVLDLDKDTFKQRSPRKIAESLAEAARRSTVRKTTPFQSAMSMLNFYINRAGKNLSAERRLVLERAKAELRRVFGRG